MLSGQPLLNALNLLPAVPFEGVTYRAVDLEALYGFHLPAPYPQPLPLFSAGARLRGARYTLIGGPDTLYLALKPEVAYAEANRVHTRVWGTSSKDAPALPPTVLISVRVHLDAVLDVTETPIQQALQTSLQELFRPWRMAQRRGEQVATQTLGQAAFDCRRFQAVRYPSAQSPGAHCLAIFPDRLVAPAFVETVDPHFNLPHRLP